MDLGRFLEAQAPVMAAVEAELRAGLKRTHWMWFVFPQLRGLGRSETARFYGLADRTEAAAFLAHPVLGPRLRHCTGLVNAVEGRTAHAILGNPDDLKSAPAPRCSPSWSRRLRCSPRRWTASSAAHPTRKRWPC